MEQIFLINFLNKKFRTYVNSRSDKPLKDIRERTSKADLHPVSFWGSSEVTLLYRAQG